MPDTQKPLTREELREELNDRFDHYEKRQDERHREMMQGFAQVIEGVNNHTTEELAALRRDLDIRKEFDHLAAALAQRLGVAVSDLTGR
jgi:IS1 family transposase